MTDHTEASLLARRLICLQGEYAYAKGDIPTSDYNELRKLQNGAYKIAEALISMHDDLERVRAAATDIVRFDVGCLSCVNHTAVHNQAMEALRSALTRGELDVRNEGDGK